MMKLLCVVFKYKQKQHHSYNVIYVFLVDELHAEKTDNEILYGRKDWHQDIVWSKRLTMRYCVVGKTDNEILYGRKDWQWDIVR